MTKFYLHSCTLTLTRPPDCGCPENVLVQKALLLKTKCEIEDLRYILLTLKHYCMNNIVKNFCRVLYETVMLRCFCSEKKIVRQGLVHFRLWGK